MFSLSSFATLQINTNATGSSKLKIVDETSQNTEITVCKDNVVVGGINPSIDEITSADFTVASGSSNIKVFIGFINYVGLYEASQNLCTSPEYSIKKIADETIVFNDNEKVVVTINGTYTEPTQVQTTVVPGAYDDELYNSYLDYGTLLFKDGDTFNTSNTFICVNGLLATTSYEARNQIVSPNQNRPKFPIGNIQLGLILNSDVPQNPILGSSCTTIQKGVKTHEIKPLKYLEIQKTTELDYSSSLNGYTKLITREVYQPSETPVTENIECNLGDGTGCNTNLNSLDGDGDGSVSITACCRNNGNTPAEDRPVKITITSTTPGQLPSGQMFTGLDNNQLFGGVTKASNGVLSGSDSTANFPTGKMLASSLNFKPNTTNYTLSQGITMSFEFSVPISEANQFEKISVYSSSSPWVALPTTYTQNGSNNVYTANITGSFAQVIFMGTGTPSQVVQTNTKGLIRTGGR